MIEIIKTIDSFNREQIEKLDVETKERLLPLLRDSELSLRQELDRFGGQDFTLRSRRGVMRSINQSLFSLNEGLVEESETSLGTYGLLGADLAKNEVNYLSAYIGGGVIPASLTEVITKPEDFLINTIKPSVEAYSASTRAEISRALSQAFITKRTGHEVVSKLSKFLKIKHYNLMRIFRTETSRVLNSSKLITYQKFKEEGIEPNLYKRLFHPQDSRTAEDSKQLKELDPIIPLNQPFRFTYYRKTKSGVETEVREFQTPPDRPNDRASMIPWSPRWKEP